MVMAGASSRSQQSSDSSGALMNFAKMQGLGNDFVVVAESEIRRLPRADELLEDDSGLLSQLAKYVCDRHFGVGADGLIVVRNSDRKDCQVGWTYINSDGSSSVMCGNGLRCLALFAQESGLVSDRSFSVSTKKGPVAIQFDGANRITSDLGEPILEANNIPTSEKHANQLLKHPLRVGNLTMGATCVSMGNPHCVIFESGYSAVETRELAPKIQELPFFPESVNVEFVDVLSPSHAKVFVWERGCGPTLACASGAAAVLVAGVLEERLSRTSTIELPGGPLEVSWSAEDNHVRITGPATMVFEGKIDVSPVLGGAAKR
jgi:diaminopimelate epimerase